ncbi:MAG: hypothetical protein JWR63_3495 [Conexibacter sp.]|nr:hypothetical protein [Conexibacter sp.]
MAGSPFRVIIRRRGEVAKRGFATLDAALDALEDETRAAATVNARAPRVERALGKDYEPAQQVAVRGELRGPGRLRAGIDVRGDGSAEAYTGVVWRRPIAPGDREDAWRALRREVRAAAR